MHKKLVEVKQGGELYLHFLWRFYLFFYVVELNSMAPSSGREGVLQAHALYTVVDISVIWI